MDIGTLLSVIKGDWVDLLIIAILLFFLIEGIFDRFLPSLFNLLGFIITYAVALKFYSVGSKIFINSFSLPFGISNALGFFSVALLGEVIYNILMSLLYKRIPEKIKTSWFNRHFGFLPALGNGVLLIAFIITLFISLPTSPRIKQSILNSYMGKFLVLRTQVVEQQIDTVFGQAVNKTLSFLTVKPQSEETIDLKFSTKNVTIDPASEEVMFAFVNQERKKAGLKILKNNTKLQEVARAHAKDMFFQGYFSHYNPKGESPFDRMNRFGITYQAAGENLAYAPTVDVADTGLINSPGHRANILSPDFGKVGIGVIDGGIYGKMFAQEFTN